MESKFGWTLLSREAVKRAELQLRDEAEGVRDEVGFLSLHQGYADRFFPGTSVLHTRLRYVLFVPWLYESLIAQVDRHGISAAIERREIALAGRLKAAGERGIIGGQRYPKPTTQPPTMVYWTALRTWRILRPLVDGTYSTSSGSQQRYAEFLSSRDFANATAPCEIRLAVRCTGLIAARDRQSSAMSGRKHPRSSLFARLPSPSMPHARWEKCLPSIPVSRQ